MKNFYFIVLIIGFIGAISLLGKLYWDRHQYNDLLNITNAELAKSNLSLGRAETKLGDAQKYISNLEKKIQDDIANRNALITQYGELEAKYNALQNFIGNGTITSSPDGSIILSADSPILMQGMLYEAFSNKELKPINKIEGLYVDHRLNAKCGFSPIQNLKREIPFKFDYQLTLKFHGELVETITPTGVVSNYFNMWEIDDKGNRLGKIEITKFSLIYNDQRTKKFYWWDPHLDIGLILGFDSNAKFQPGGSLGVSFMGYGLTKNDLLWRFLRLSMDLSDSPGLGFSPAIYNIGEILPLVSNIWISPHMMFNLSRNWWLGFMIGAVL